MYKVLLKVFFKAYLKSYNNMNLTSIRTTSIGSIPESGESCLHGEPFPLLRLYFLFFRILGVCLCFFIIPPCSQDSSSCWPPKKVVRTVAKIEFLFNLYGFVVRRSFCSPLLKPNPKSLHTTTHPPAQLLQVLSSHSSRPIPIPNWPRLEPTQLLILLRLLYWNLFHIIFVGHATVWPRQYFSLPLFLIPTLEHQNPNPRT